jgi:indole-3-glycerol phosphate synthase
LDRAGRAVIDAILARKRREVERRLRHVRLFDAGDITLSEDRGPAALSALRRKGSPTAAVIAELKFASPSEGPIRARSAGAGVEIARAYASAGAAAVSVLADRAGFEGSALEVRRVARALDRPVLFKEFVVDAVQIDLARAAGAAMVLLLVRALDDGELERLVRYCRERGLEALVEAWTPAEVERALATDARIIGVNARDLATFRVDPALAQRAIQKIPENRVAVYMSGVSSREELERVSRGRADAVLIGTALMRAPDPGARLSELLGGGA